jgi:hypothetical protein
MKRLLFLFFVATILSSCGRKVYLTGEEKLYLHYEVGDTLKLVNQSNSDSIVLITKSNGTSMEDGCGNETVYEYGYNYLEMDSSYCSICVRATSSVSVELKTAKIFIDDYYTFSKSLDTLEINNTLYTNVNYLKGSATKLYFSFEKGILKITNLQDSSLVEMRP